MLRGRVVARIALLWPFAAAFCIGRPGGTAPAVQPKVMFKEPGGVYSIAFSPDGKLIAAGVENGPLDLLVVGSGERRSLIRPMGRIPGALAFSRDGSTLVTGMGDGAILVWDVAGGTQRREIHGDGGLAVECLAVSADGRSVLVYPALGGVATWDLQTGARHGTVELKGPHDVGQAAFSADGKTLVTLGLDHAVRVWDTATGKLRFSLKGHTNIPERVAITPDGKMAVTGGQDNAARAWDLVTGRPAAVLKHRDFIYGLAISPDGSRAASNGMGGEPNIRVWGTRDGRVLATFPGGMDGNRALAFSPDGKLLAGAEFDTVKVWEVP